MDKPQKTGFQPPRYETQIGHESPFVVTRRVFSSGLVETTGYFQSRSDDSHLYAKPSKRRAAAELEKDGIQERSVESVKVSKRSLRRLVYQLGPDRMLTLTFKENVVDFEEAKRAWHAFQKGWKRHFPDSPLVAVPERQKRGAWHFHCAILGFHDLRQIHSIWKHGAVNMRRGASRSRVARYLSKYLGKDLSLLGRAAYRVINRKLLTKPITKTYKLFLAAHSETWLKLTALFVHRSLSSFCEGGIYWRLEHATEIPQRDDDRPCNWCKRWEVV